jgi:hypothetical protein
MDEARAAAFGAWPHVKSVSDVAATTIATDHAWASEFRLSDGCEGITIKVSSRKDGELRIGRIERVVIEPASCRHREFAVHGLLPDVGIDVAGNGLLLFGGERWGGELGEHLIKDEHLDVGLRLLLFPEAI